MLDRTADKKKENFPFKKMNAQPEKQNVVLFHNPKGLKRKVTEHGTPREVEETKVVCSSGHQRKKLWWSTSDGWEASSLPSSLRGSNIEALRPEHHQERLQFSQTPPSRFLVTNLPRDQEKALGYDILLRGTDPSGSHRSNPQGAGGVLRSYLPSKENTWEVQFFDF